MKKLIPTILCILLFSFAACKKATKKLPQYEVFGIDVSHHQKDVDWKKMSGQGVDFAFIKATEGGDFKDTKFKVNWEALAQTKILKGAYHFFRPGTTVQKQIDNFTSTVPKETMDLPPVLDIELGYKWDTQELADSLSLWLKGIEAHYLIKPIVYCNMDFYEKLASTPLQDYSFWIARYGANEPFLAEKNWLFWQHGQFGHLEGIETFVDFNVFCCPLDSLKKVRKKAVKGEIRQ